MDSNVVTVRGEGSIRGTNGNGKKYDKRKLKVFTKQRKKKPQINNLTSHLKELEKEQSKPKTSRRKEILEHRKVKQTTEEQ